MDRAVIAAIRESIPQYNEYLLRGFMAHQISQSAQFVAMVFREAVKLFRGAITFKEYKILDPAERAMQELKLNDGCKTAISELLLVKYIFLYQEREYSTLIYIPYLKNDVIVIDDTRYVLQRSIKEQVASRITHGITLKVLRQPLHFYRNQSFRMESLSDDWIQTESIATAAIHKVPRQNRRKMIDVTVIHYLLCKFGYLGTLARFGLTADDCVFTEVMEGDSDTYRYFAAKAYAKNSKRCDLFLKVKKDRLDDPLITRLVANLLYTLTAPAFQRYRLEEFYEPSGQVFRVMMGKIINGSGSNEIQSTNKIDTHMASLDTYLDPLTQARLSEYNIEVHDIYDLLQYVFSHINEIIHSTTHTNLYNSRIDYIEELLVETIVKSIYYRWYQAETDPKKLNPGEVQNILRFPRDLITKLHTSRIVLKNPPAYGDNALVGHLCQKIRQSGLSNSGRIIRSPDHRFHPSMAVVESLIAYSKSNPGAAGSINPYLPITPNGSVIHPDYADEIDRLLPDLPYQ